MTGRFSSFVLFAEMRTGSNFLETNLNLFEDISCHGEAFNPHFIGYPNEPSILGVNQREREKDPQKLLDAVRDAEGINGFRYFHDHDPRILETVLNDPSVAKIILTRNPLESYVSWKIAKTTGQWKLTNVSHRRKAKAVFDRAEFEDHLEQLRAFQLHLQNGLQTTGQTAFYIAYEDINSLEVVNGLGRFLGSDHQLEALSKALKKQNPAALEDKVENYPEMQAALSRVDHFNLGQTPNFEPRRPAAIPSYIGSSKSPLLYMPIASGPHRAVNQWLADLDGVTRGDLLRDLSQKTLRQWKRNQKGHRTFTVVRHPVVRAHRAFCDRIIGAGDGSFPAIRATLEKVFDLSIPDDPANYDLAQHKTAFGVFLEFVKANLNGQTSVRIDPNWASQINIIQGFAQFAPPDAILREDSLEEGLAGLAAQTGCTAPMLHDDRVDAPFSLEEVYDEEIERKARDAYQRDYMSFGYGPWAKT
ncbi:sulfotransferase family 2 domain-containing protein [Nereida sp. MMG025]|uniref:sulfotransferase family 2 domain-containing protein n=1 Tax=Nereida sp. MMG025 TaxID=2909981 RepID=UPI001EEDE2B8|nr:sulfotransferase family 2 domain-containing protein [Nereida sp. MMG025]MCF6444553.1 sulfotransferase family 2 domain-containing protein [Nereida sp. MMG025]